MEGVSLFLHIIFQTLTFLQEAQVYTDLYKAVKLPLWDIL